MLQPVVQRLMPLFNPEIQDSFLDASERVILFTSTAAICCVVAGILSPAIATIAAVIVPLAVGIFVTLVAQIYRNTFIKMLEPTVTNIVEVTAAGILGIAIWRIFEDYLLYRAAFR